MRYPGRFPAAIAAISFFALSILLPASAQAGSSSPVLDRIQKSGKLVVGTSANMPLMSEKMATGEVVGFDIDMATALAQSMGVKLEIKVIPFDQLVPALEQGKVDAVFSNMTMTVERNMHVAFAGPYFVSGKCLITKEEDVAKKSDTSELKAEDISIAVVRGSTSEDFVKELLPALKRVPVTTVDKGTDLVDSGKAKAMMTDFPICLSVMKRYPDKGFQSVVSLLTYEPIGIALPAGDPLFINLAENFVKRAEGVGLNQELALKWFGDAVISIIENEQSKQQQK